MKKLIAPAIAVLFSIILYISCDDVISSEDIDSRVIPDQNVNYMTYIQPIFDAKCNTAGCHNDYDRAGALSFTTWSNATADPSIVFPGKPENSILIWAIQGQGASLMPPIYAPVTGITPNQFSGISTWILEGAENN